jgi:tetratricopeptide (TPR) repeat protein
MLASPRQEEQLLSQRHEHDRTDPFASDSDEGVRRLGRLALRRPVFDPSDSFAIGDRCAQLSLRDDQLLITYVGKTLIAYRRAGRQSVRQQERDLAAQGVERYVQWVVQAAQVLGTPRNIAVALWAAAEFSVPDQPGWLRDEVAALVQQYTAALTSRPAERETIEAPLVNLRGILEEGERQATSDHRTVMSPFVDPADSLLREFEGPHPLDEDDQEALSLINSLLVSLRDDATHTSVGLDHDAMDEADVEAALRGGGDGHDEATSFTPGSRGQQSDSPNHAPAHGSPEAGSPAAKPPPKVWVRPTDDAEDEASEDFRVGDWLYDKDPSIRRDRYEVKRILKGGMGIIYICRDFKEKDAEEWDLVAVKTFQGRFLTNERAAARFVQEAAAWMRLEKHPNIVQARRVQSFQKDALNERPHIIMEYVPHAENLSADLKSWIEAGVLTLESALRIALDICRGMLHATTMMPGLVHRDLKPGNILVRYDGLAKVTDFGLVRTLDQREADGDAGEDEAPEAIRLTRAGAIVGTAAYMSPEQTYARDTDVRSDVYAFGAILWEMLTRQQVFQARTFDEWLHAHRHEIPRFPPSLPARVPIPLRRLIMDCLDKRPESRPANWAVVMRDLAAIYESVTGGPAPAADSDSAMKLNDVMDKAYGLSELGYHAEANATYDRALSLAPPGSLAWVWGRKANNLRFSGDIAAAEAAFDSALSLDPNQAWVWRTRGWMYLSAGQQDAAVQAFQKATTLRPTDELNHIGLARALNALRRYQEALDAAEAALNLAPHHAEAHAARAQSLAALGRNDDALAAYDRLLGLRRRDAWAWYSKAKLLRKLYRRQEALEAIREATRYLATSHWFWLLKAQLLHELGNHDEALDAIRHVTALAPDFLDGWRSEGAILSAMQRPDEALAAFDRALRLRPDDAPALAAKSRLLQTLQRHEEALSALAHALHQEADSVPLLRSKLESLLVLKRHFEAVVALERLVVLAPDNPHQWALLGKLRRQLRQPEQALDAYQRAVKLRPDIASAWSGLGLTQAMLGRATEALASFERAIQGDPGRAWYWYNKASALFDLERYVDCLEALDEAQDRDDRLLECWIKRGQALRNLGRYKEALEALDEATSLAPGHAWAWGQRGLTLAEMRRYAEALASYERAIAIAPENVWFYLNQIDPLVNLERGDDALAVAETAIRVAPGSTIPLLRKGAILRQLEQYEAALGVYEQALAINPKEFGAWYGKARANRALNRMADALTCFQRLLEYYPKHVTAWVWYGETLLEANQPREALAAFEQALRRDPSHGLAQRRRDETRTLLGEA